MLEIARSISLQWFFVEECTTDPNRQVRIFYQFHYVYSVASSQTYLGINVLREFSYRRKDQTSEVFHVVSNQSPASTSIAEQNPAAG